MILAICIDDTNGMMFNHRRVSSDKMVIQDILLNVDADIVAIAPYSLPLFKDFESNVVVAEDLLHSGNTFCFAESGDFLEIRDEVQKLIVYKWNRRYPSDCKFPMELFRTVMRLNSVEEFQGYSHECITKEVYVR